MLRLPGILAVLLFAGSILPALSDEGFRPDDHAPVGVMRDHTHSAGQWMASYRFAQTSMGDLRSGTEKRSADEVLASTGYRMAPTSMTMTMHMFGAMYGASDSVTAMVMEPYVLNSMDMKNGMTGAVSSEESRGFGDLRASAMFGAWVPDLQFNFGVSVPTGSIEKTGSDGQRLPYLMQLGSGTWDLLPGVVYRRLWREWSLGAQADFTLRLGKNEDHYSLGNGLEASVWGAYRWNDRISSSLRLSADSAARYSGSDPAIENRRAMMPTADAANQGGTDADLWIGSNFGIELAPENVLRVAVEFGVPILQNRLGVQMSRNWALATGVQADF